MTFVISGEQRGFDMENPNHKKYTYTIGVLFFHRTPELVAIGEKCLDSILSCIDPTTTELVVVDNGSTMENKRWEKEATTYIRFSENLGVSAGWNAILRNARGAYIAILGDDTEVQSGWLEAMRACFDQHDDCGVANPYVEHLPKGQGIQKDNKWFSGACFMLTPRTIERAGYFRQDLYFPTNYEDTDYWCRVLESGLYLYKNHAIEVKHLEGQTTKATDLDAAKQGTKAAFLKEWGFDPVPYFCSGDSIYKKLHIPE